ncbi:hypothetical protein DRN73_06285 [Candidatus Pacearchaeota archaeon]|nr:MAG: hypothetical protein DRN73_06285 [Candidatus Pacearchaeota archaeon]
MTLYPLDSQRVSVQERRWDPDGFSVQCPPRTVKRSSLDDIVKKLLDGESREKILEGLSVDDSAYVVIKDFPNEKVA